MFRALLLLAAAAGLTAAADPPPDAPLRSVREARGIEGQWRNTRNTVHLKVSECGESLCGTVIWAVPQARQDARRGSGQDLIGRALFREFQQVDDGTWRGKVYIPDINANASAKITQLDRDTMLVSGCLFLKIACKTQHWWRMK